MLCQVHLRWLQNEQCQGPRLSQAAAVRVTVTAAVVAQCQCQYKAQLRMASTRTLQYSGLCRSGLQHCWCRLVSCLAPFYPWCVLICCGCRSTCQRTPYSMQDIASCVAKM